MKKFYTILVRKPMDYEHLLHDQKQLLYDVHTSVETFKINTIVEISHDEFESLKTNMLSDRQFIKNQNEIFLVKEAGTSDYDGLIIDAQGFDYPRYVGIPMQEVDIKNCPSCSKYYTSPSSISRKDNKTQICPSCGVKEALEAFGINSEMLEFLGKSQTFSDTHNAKITIQIPSKEDIIIEPNNN